MRQRGDTCVIIPTYNHAPTLCAVVEGALAQGLPVVVVDDGSTDATAQVLLPLAPKITTVAYQPNKGKGHALQVGFKKARALGYKYALTMDADAQHRPEDIPLFLDALAAHPGALLIGQRSFAHKDMPSGNVFANRFSNFWFTVQTGCVLADTQTGFRLYPLERLSRLTPVSSRYATELEFLVRLAWRNVPLVEVPVNVYYAPRGERVSHFKKGRDFLRISLLNTGLTLLAIVYGHPSRLIRKCL